MVRRGKDNDHTKSGQLRRRGQYRIQHVMMMIVTLWTQKYFDASAFFFKILLFL